MTKSSWGGHRKGAGRPRFAKTGKTSNFSTRLTPETRARLEAEAMRRGKSLSEVAEDLLQLGLEEMADLGRPKPLRALFFLIEALSNEIDGPHWQDAEYSWRSNPYMFAALRAGIIGLLDRLRPPGEIIEPPPGPEVDVGDGLFQHTFPESPEEYARWIVDGLIYRARSRASMEKHRESANPEAIRQHYGFVDAHRDLRLVTIPATRRRKQK